VPDNLKRYGLRWFKGPNGESTPGIERHRVADAYHKTINGGGTVDLNIGDVVALVSDGTIAHCDGTEGAGGELEPYGVIASIIEYFDGTRMVTNTKVPGATTGGGVEGRITKVGVIPLGRNYFKMQADDKTTAATEAAYRAFLGENCEFVNTYLAATRQANPQLDISTHAVTATFAFRLVDIAQTVNNIDFAESNVDLVVQGNALTQAGAPSNATIRVGV